MIGEVLFYIYYTVALLAGIVLSAAFSGVRMTKKNVAVQLGIFALCGSLQLGTLLLGGEQRVWELYPLIVHLPLGLCLCLVYRKQPATALAAIVMAYLCCQPANWFGLLMEAVTDKTWLVMSVQLAVMVAVAALLLRFYTGSIAEIFNKDTRSVLIFGSMPFIYYLYDYMAGIYTDLWEKHQRLTAEFLAFFLCIAFFVFCIAYYREYERKMQVERENQMAEIMVRQQAKEIEAIRKSNTETSLLRHDLRHLLSNVALRIEQNDKESALSLISGYTTQVEAASLHRFCLNDVVNYVLTDFEAKCQRESVSFQVDLEMEELPVDEVIFTSIVSNALENALNAQRALPPEKRQIKLVLRRSDGKLLLSVKNPFAGPSPIDPLSQLPVTTKTGHGYGTQSILYLTEKLGGKCRFAVQNDIFILRIVL